MLAAGFADMDVIFLDMQCSKTSVGSVGKLLKIIIKKMHLQMKLSGNAAGFFCCIFGTTALSINSPT